MKRTKNIKKITFLRKLKLWLNKGRNRNLLSEEIFYLYSSFNYHIIQIDCAYCGEITIPLFINPKEFNPTEQDRLMLKCYCEIPRHSKDIRVFRVRYIRK